MGLVLGLWAFDGPMAAPKLLAEYGDTPRRLLRLSHIAWIALGLMNVVLALTASRLSQSDPPLSPATLRWALVCMNIGSVCLPLCLLVAVFVPSAKYLLALPASCVVVTAAAMTMIGWCRTRPIPPALAEPAQGVES